MIVITAAMARGRRIKRVEQVMILVVEQALEYRTGGRVVPNQRIIAIGVDDLH